MYNITMKNVKHDMLKKMKLHHSFLFIMELGIENKLGYFRK